MNNNTDIHIIADLIVFTPITLLSAMGKKPPEPLLALAFIYAGVRAINLLQSITQPSPVLHNTSLQRYTTVNYQ